MFPRPVSARCTTTRSKLGGVFLWFLGFLAAMNPCAMATTAITVMPVTLELFRDGRKAGSTKIPAGREVTVLETRDGRVKISVSPIISGWVSLGAVKISQTEELQTSVAEDGEAATNPEQSAAIAEPAPPASTGGSGGGIGVGPSKLMVREGHNTKEQLAQPPDKCRGTLDTFSFQPKIVRGEDLKGSEASLRFYLISLRENKAKTAASSALRRVVIDGQSFSDKKKVYEPAVRRLKDIPVPEGDAPIEPIMHDNMKWKCSCCRDDKNGEYLGWYAELVSGDKVISKAQSSMDPRAAAALKSYLEKSPEMPEAPSAASGSLDGQQGKPLKARPYVLSIAGADITLQRWGTGDKAIIFFNHSGPMDQMVAQQIASFGGLFDQGYSVCAWDYPRGSPPFDKIEEVLGDAARGKRSGPLDFSGIASAVVEQVRSKCGVKDVVLVGNSLGAGIILWDRDKLSADPGTSLVLISPTEMFSPKPSKLEPLNNGIIIANENGDRFVETAQMKRWIAKNKYAEDLQPPLPSGHLILGQNLPFARVPGLIALKAETTDTP